MSIHIPGSPPLSHFDPRRLQKIGLEALNNELLNQNSELTV